MRVGILGSGLMGGKLGTLFAKAGHEVVFSYARERAKLDRLARRAGDRAVAGTPKEAAEGADAVLLAVHWSRVDDVLALAGDLTGRVVISCSLPMNADDTELIIGRTTSGSEQLAARLLGAPLVAAFNTIPSEVLFDVFANRRKKVRPSMLYCGDDARAKKRAVELIRDIGFEPLDAGPLRSARYTEPLGLLIGELAYRQRGGPRVAYRFERHSGKQPRP